MEISKRVEKFQNDLNNPAKNNGPFNIWAFIFSSFYFFYVDMVWYFLLFFILPYIIMLPFMLFCGPDVAFVWGFAIAHLAAGLVANPLCKRYKQKFVAKYKNANSTRQVEYFAISLKRLVVLTILSSGLYTIYWGFKNWRAYQQKTNDAVNPYVRAWFFNLTVIPLFGRMQITLKPKKSFVWWGVLCLLVFVAQTIVLNWLSMPALGAWQTWMLIALFWVLTLVYPLGLVPVQMAVNRYNTEKLKKTLTTRVSPWEVGFVVLGLLCNVAASIPETHPDLTFEQAHRAGASVGFIYRHTQIYNRICQGAGYELKKYPEDFKAYFATEIDNLKADLAQYGYSIKYIEDEYITPEIEALTEESAREELEQLRRIWILAGIAQQANIPITNIAWRDDMDNLLTLQDTCEIFDEIGIDMLKDGSNADFLQKNALQ